MILEQQGDALKMRNFRHLGELAIAGFKECADEDGAFLAVWLYQPYAIVDGDSITLHCLYCKGQLYFPALESLMNFVEVFDEGGYPCAFGL
jgi:hypothetical protein